MRFHFMHFALALHVSAVSGELALGQSLPNVQHFLPWGIEVSQEIDSTLKLPGKSLFAETAHLNGSQSGGWNGKAFAWSLSTQFRAFNSLTRYNPGVYAPILTAFADDFHSTYWSSSGGYFCCSGGGDRFYDDNAHLAVALAEAYEVTGDHIHLDRAIATYDFLLTGEAPGANGGSYWSVANHSFLDTSAALQGARAALMLYKATGDSAYLENAHRRYSWAKDTTQLPGGTFLEKLYLTGPKAGQVGDYDLVHYAGYAIAANTQFYDVTGEQSYLTEAQRITNASLPRYFNASTGRIGDEGYWAYELVDGLVDLYRRDGNPLWLSKVAGAMQWLHDNKQDPEGHYGLFWGREGRQIGVLESWDLNNQAPVARAYLHTALVQTPPLAPIHNADFNGDAAVDGADFLTWQRGLGLTRQPSRAAGNADGDDAVDPADLGIWQNQFGVSSLTAVNAVIPEPPSATLMIAAFALRACQVRRRPPLASCQ